MRIGSRVRRIYERRPYPPPSLRRSRLGWPLPAMEWIDAVRGRFPAASPRRVLVAGCGVGTEAFAIARHLPKAEVVGVDFSPRSIATARKLQRSVASDGRVRFEVGDLTSPDLMDIVGERFDLVSCHGVLSYIPEPVRVLRNLRQVLSAGGSLFLGVNGATHPSKRFRALLPGFGIEVDEFRRSSQVREILRAYEALSYPAFRMSETPDGYLAGDLFGPFNQTLSLAEWNRIWREAGLHLHGSFRAFFLTRVLINRDLYRTVMPRSRAELSELSDALEPASFHQLVLSREAPVQIPWNDGKKLLRWRAARTAVYQIKWPRSGRGSLQTVRLRNKALNTKVTLNIPRWEVEILKSSDGELSLKEILSSAARRVPPEDVSEALYVLYLLGAMNLLPQRPRV